MKIFFTCLMLLALLSKAFPQTWQQTPLDSNYVKCMLFDETNNYLFVGTLYSDGVYLSTDYGNTWLVRSNGLSSTSIYGLAKNTSGTLFAATWGGGMFRSTNNGLNWTQINNGITNSVLFSVAVNPANNYVFAGSGGSGIYRSTDNGNNWTLVNNGLTSYNILALAVAANGYIFAGTYDGVFRSTDNGDNWTATSITSGWGEGFAMNNPVYNVIAAVHTGGLYLSTDFGNTFQLAPGISSVWTTASTTFGYIYAAPYANGLYRSTDNGDTWATVNNGLTNLDVRAIAIAPNGTVFIGSFGGGVFKSDQPIPVELNSFLAYFDVDRVYLKWQTASETNNKGFEILKSSSGDESESKWESIGFVDGKGNSTELINYSFVDQDLSSGKYWYRLKQIDFDGSYKLSDKILVEVPVPTSTVLFQNYPNPFNAITNIVWHASVSGLTRLKIFNSLGQEISQFYERYNEPGTYTLQLDLNKLTSINSSGIYFYKLEIFNNSENTSRIFTDTKKLIYLK
ncbi:Hypothetical protein IALB_1261 [Ignavibacterium album JCM 16511]|uniref:Secretion system C-terminal sorting domain-containing protein n=1 Tax=Ignavibacterium album (strain DSM 19864 / JCM 16511 / NBRC 101810 / Mat9-16) TaxID=945713 RepID=I0AJ14_IGNAJ|nr:T9SS type A sorting domain-containing protein [Ignavibacterium album]AFH48971.1 Hypothetical protein IALB_1261 [Ignavibacterium album JCM 16511]